MIHNLRIPQKLALLLGVLLGALVAASAYGMFTLRQSQQDAARQVQGEREVLAAVRAGQPHAADALEAQLQQATDRLAASQAEAVRQATFFYGGVALLAALLGLWISRSIQLHVLIPVRRAAAAARSIADGDLTRDVQVVGRGELARMLAALGEMTVQLRGLVGEVVGSAHSVADTSSQLAQGNLDLSQRTEEQASTLQQTSASLEDLTSTVGRNAQNARQAARLASDASEVARRGGTVVGEVVSTMTDISLASRRIEDIIGVIDGIAFQTNILALNAAVEAARAGEQGRGFAVVAAEVRSLAQRSATASREIKALIGDSAGKVEAGTRLVDAAGQTMEQIVQAVAEVTELITQIATASEEQSSGIEQVHLAMTQMDHVVQQNASLVEEAAAATESLKDRSSALLQLVARFRLESAAPAPEPAPLRTRPEPRRLAGSRAPLLAREAPVPELDRAL